MLVLLYMSVGLVFASAGGNKIKRSEDAARSAAKDIGLTYQNNEERWARQNLISDNSKYHMSERSEDTFHDYKQAALNRFLQSVNQTSAVQNCRTGPFACITIPFEIAIYLERNLGQTRMDWLGTFPTNQGYSKLPSTYSGPTVHLNSDPKQLSAYAFKFSDPEWRNQWYMQDYRVVQYAVMDHNVVPVLNKGITGLSVTVAVIGDGVKEHPDLGRNYDRSLSYDFCDGIRFSATPSWTKLQSGYTYDTTGTSSAGVIAMNSGNNICGVGIAPDAKIAGLRIRGCNKSPKANIEANAFIYKLQDIDIYCNTWTNDDEMGEKVIDMSNTLEYAYKRGIKEGRDNKGAIYVFPSGSNKENNNCATNGFLNNPYVITIGSAASDGTPASYSERCTAIFAAGYSGDKYIGTEDIMTIDADGRCSNFDMNKPISSAMACGIFALLLQHKPSLTYRDVMHLIVMTAEVAPLANNKRSWYLNRMGFWVSNDFGFGLLNAENMITMATGWTTVPDKNICVLYIQFNEPVYFDHTKHKLIQIDASECRGPQNRIVYLEHVELSSTIEYYYRGAIYLNLTSPAGTNSKILEPRLKDFHRSEGIKNLNIMSLHNWGENPQGKWFIRVMACPIHDVDKPHGYIKEFTLTLHGTEERPAHYASPRKYAYFRLAS